MGIASIKRKAQLGGTDFQELTKSSILDTFGWEIYKQPSRMVKYELPFNYHLLNELNKHFHF